MLAGELAATLWQRFAADGEDEIMERVHQVVKWCCAFIEKHLQQSVSRVDGWVSLLRSVNFSGNIFYVM